MNGLLQPPHSIASEQSVLGGLLISNEKIIDVMEILRASDFFHRSHRLIFAEMVRQYTDAEAFDIITLSESDVEKDIELSYLAQIGKDTPSSSNVHIYAGVVCEKAKRRQVITIATKLTEKAYQDDSEITDAIYQATTRLDAIGDISAAEDVGIAELCEITEQSIIDGIEAKKSNKQIEMPVGISRIDQRLGGFQKGKVYVIAARPGHGKTAFSNQITIETAKQGKRVGIISLEMSKRELGIRLLSSYYGINGTELTNSNETTYDALMTKQDEYRTAGKPLLRDFSIYLDTETYSLRDICTKMTQWKRKYDVDMIVLDHIGLVEQKSNSRHEAVSEVSRTMKKMAKKLDVALIEVVQLNRENVKNNRRPKAFDLRDSGNIEADADAIIFLTMVEGLIGDEIRKLDIGIEKLRYGVSGWFCPADQAPPFVFVGATQRIKEIDFYERY